MSEGTRSFDSVQTSSEVSSQPLDEPNQKIASIKSGLE